MAVRRPEFIPFCYVTSAIKFIYSATQSRRVADAGELPEVPGPPLPPPATRPVSSSPPPPPPLRPSCSTGENETANEYWKRARDCKWCIVDCGNILREKEQNENIRTLEILFTDENRSRREKCERRMQNCLLLPWILAVSGLARRAIIECN